MNINERFIQHAKREIEFLRTAGRDIETEIKTWIAALDAMERFTAEENKQCQTRAAQAPKESEHKEEQ